MHGSGGRPGGPQRYSRLQIIQHAYPRPLCPKTPLTRHSKTPAARRRRHGCRGVDDARPILPHRDAGALPLSKGYRPLAVQGDGAWTEAYGHRLVHFQPRPLSHGHLRHHARCYRRQHRCAAGMPMRMRRLAASGLSLAPMAERPMASGLAPARNTSCSVAVSQIALAPTKRSVDTATSTSAMSALRLPGLHFEEPCPPRHRVGLHQPQRHDTRRPARPRCPPRPTGRRCSCRWTAAGSVRRRNPWRRPCSCRRRPGSRCTRHPSPPSCGRPWSSRSRH